MIHGIVDVGSNTVRLNVYFYKNNHFKLLLSKKENLGLAMYVKNGNLSKIGIEKAVLILESMKKDFKYLKIKNFSFFATASLRNINNSSKIIEIIEKKTDIKIHLLSGEKEGELSFIGSKKILEGEEGILVDIGGGSTEIVFFDKKKIKDSYSLPIGSLKLYTDYVSDILPNNVEKKLIEERIVYELDKLNLKKTERYKKYMEKDEKFICGVGGTFRVFKKMLLFLNIEKEGKEGKEGKKEKERKFISPKSLKSLEEELEENNKDTYNKILMVKPSRIHTLIPGILIIKSIVSYFDCDRIQISDFGLREGYLYNKIMEKEDE